MRVAVITPTHKEREEVLKRCTASVEGQARDGIEVVQVVTYDGMSPQLPDVEKRGDYTLVRLVLPGALGPSGSCKTARGTGAVFALNRFDPDAIAFLDADNEWRPNHLALCCEAATRRAVVVSAQRVLVHQETGAELRVDTFDSDGENFTDANCLFLAGYAINFARNWGWKHVLQPSPYAKNTGYDRALWRQIRVSVPPEHRARLMAPTVLYYTPWLMHYGPNDKPPARCKLMVREGGTVVAHWVRPLEWDDERGWKCQLCDTAAEVR